MRVEFHHTKNGLPSWCGLVHEAERRPGDFLVHRLHALFGQRAGVFNRAAGVAVNNTTRAEFLFELRVRRIIGVLRLFLGVQVIQIAVELVEAVIGRQHVIAISETKRATLSGRPLGYLTC